jgi:acyl-CoA hydrolase
VNNPFAGLRPGSTVALSDGCGIPAGLCGPLSDAARAVGGIRLILGWCLELPDSLDLTAFADARTFFAGNGLRDGVKSGSVKYVGARYSSLSALFQTVWKPDVLVCSVRPGHSGLSLGTEVGWIPSAARAAGRIVAELNHALPLTTYDDDLAGLQIDIGAECERSPLQIPTGRADDVTEALGRNVASLIHEGATIQFGPGLLGKAVLDQVHVPVRLISGVIGDSVVDLDHRGLLLGDPVSAYLVGTDLLYNWADGRPTVGGPARTHDTGVLVAADIIAINTALQIDLSGQVNVEFGGSRPIAALGGHSDFASAAVRTPRGASIVAMPTIRNGRSTLVDTLTSPTSTARSDVEYVVTEHGIADLRGTDDERARLLRPLWP